MKALEDPILIIASEQERGRFLEAHIRSGVSGQRIVHIASADQLDQQVPAPAVLVVQLSGKLGHTALVSTVRRYFNALIPTVFVPWDAMPSGFNPANGIVRSILSTKKSQLFPDCQRAFQLPE